jgi:prepilin peptidase CpaA
VDAVVIGLKLGIVVLLVAGAAVDLKTRRIPNFLTFGGTVLGAVANVAVSGQDGLIHSGTGWIVGVMLLAIPFMLRGIGGGDVKLLAAAGAWGGPVFVLNVAFLGALVGAVVAIAFLVVRGESGRVIRPIIRTLRWQVALALSGVLSEAQARDLAPTGANPSVSLTKTYFPYGPALAIGGLVALFLR